MVPSGVDRIDKWIADLRDRDFTVRRAAAEHLGNISDRKAIKPLIEILEDTSEYQVVRNIAAKTYYLIAKSDINAVISLGAVAIEPLINIYGDNDLNIREILKKICIHVTAVTFGSIQRNTDTAYLKDPDVSKLGVPMENLNKIIIDAESYDFHKVERFITYAVNYIGEKHLKKNVEV